MYIFELVILIGIGAFWLVYRNYRGQNVSKYLTEQSQVLFNKFAPYSFHVVREKTKQLGQEYTLRQYTTQVALFATFAGIVSWVYFYNLIICVIYIVIVVMFIPYLSFLRCKRIYSEFLFEQVQVYTTNTIMEFATTQSFVKAIEGVRNSGVLEDPVKRDVSHMIELAYQNGTIDESLEYMNNLYPYYIVKNMHQLFLQITNEGARNTADSLDNMQIDIDMLVESVYRDRIDRQSFHKQFLQFGLMLYILIMTVQYLVGTDTYISLLETWYVQLLLHGTILGNSYFLLKGEKYYNENVGAE